MFQVLVSSKGCGFLKIECPAEALRLPVQNKFDTIGEMVIQVALTHL